MPQVEGIIHINGLLNDVIVVRDRWGIPHIKASNRTDLYFAQGFVHAQDRLWQMDINRRAAAGRLAEILGPLALQSDRLARTLGFYRLGKASWEQTDEPVRHDVTAYTAGINSFLNSGAKLPIEFSLLRYEPEPWTINDSAAFGRLMPWPLSHVWAVKLLRAQLIEKVGPDLAQELEPYYPERNPITLPHGIEFNQLGLNDMLIEANGPFLNSSIQGSSLGSNAWVISASKSSTGRPLLCNDMHLPIGTPSLWYYNQLVADQSGKNEEDIHVAGVSLPGVPYVMVGHNQHIAWGATVSFIDVEDLFIERFDPNDPSRYLYKGDWLKAERYEERIKIKGKQDHLETVKITSHGPVISSLGTPSETTLSLQSIALQPEAGFAGFAMLGKAHDWNDFVGAVRRLTVPPLNLVYADDKNNIGYYVSGKVPIRKQGQGQLPVPGWTGEYEWEGYVPFEEMPHAYNPSAGFIVSANHQIIGDNYPHYLGVSWRNGYRARRIEELINSSAKISPGQCQEFQMDMKSIPGLETALFLASVETDDPQAKISLDQICSWDGWLTPKCIGGTVYQVFIAKLAEAILQSKLDNKLLEEVLGIGSDPIFYPANELHGHWPAVLIKLLDDPDSDWWPSGTSQSEVIIRCLAETTEFLQSRLGADPNDWQRGKLHQLRLDHILAAKPPLDEIFSHGPLSVGGDTNTIVQTAVMGTNPGDNIAPSYRQVIDLGNFESSVAMFAPGQSGQLGSQHYGDLVEPWLSGNYFPMTWDWNSVSSTALFTLVLSAAAN
jgi:penicillin amidase